MENNKKYLNPEKKKAKEEARKTMRLFVKTEVLER